MLFRTLIELLESKVLYGNAFYRILFSSVFKQTYLHEIISVSFFNLILNALRILKQKGEK